MRALQFPGLEVGGVVLDIRPRQSVNYWVDERESFFDPYTGALLGTRRFGDLSEGEANVLTSIYRLHYSLNLGGFGSFVFGIVAVL